MGQAVRDLVAEACLPIRGRNMPIALWRCCDRRRPAFVKVGNFYMGYKRLMDTKGLIYLFVVPTEGAGLFRRTADPC